MKLLFFLLALAASAQQIKINPITGLPDLVGTGGGGAVSSVTAGPLGALVCTPTTGAVVCDVDSAYVPNKTGSNTWTGTNDFTGGSLLIPGLSTVGSVPYVSSAGVLAQDGSFLRTAIGKYTLFDQTGGTGDSRLIVKAGAGQSSNMQEWQNSAGSSLAAITKDGFAYFGGSTGMQLRGDTSQLFVHESGTARAIFSFRDYLSIGISADTALSWSSGAQATGSVDTGLARNAAGILEVNNGTAGTYRDIRARRTQTGPVAVSALQTCNAGNAGSVQAVNDALGPVLGAAVVGGGAVVAQVFCNGTTWDVSAF